MLHLKYAHSDNLRLTSHHLRWLHGQSKCIRVSAVLRFWDVQQQITNGGPFA